MKRTTIIAGALILAGALTGTKAYSQFYAKVNAGYALGMGEHGSATNYTSTQSGSSTSFTEESVKVSYGKGVNFGLSAGYFFSDNFGFELGLDYLMGGKVVDLSKYEGTTPPYPYTWTTTTSASMLRIMPVFVIKASGNSISPYAKFGLTVGSGKINGKEELAGSNGTGFTEYEFTGGMAIGFNAAFGVDISISDKMSLFGEMRYIGLNYAPSKGTLLKYEEDGVDKMGEQTTRDKEIEFKDKLSGSSGTPSDPNKPDEMLKFGNPFSSIGLNVGLKFNF